MRSDLKKSTKMVRDQLQLMNTQSLLLNNE